MFQSDVDSTRSCLCQEEEEEEDRDEGNSYEAESYSPSLAQESQQSCAPEDLSNKQEQTFRGQAPGEGCREEDALEEPREESGEDHEGRDIDCAITDEPLGSRLLQSGGQSPPFSNYLYFKHRDEGLKELLERKMEKQAVLLGV